MQICRGTLWFPSAIYHYTSVLIYHPGLEKKEALLSPSTMGLSLEPLLKQEL